MNTQPADRAELIRQMNVAARSIPLTSNNISATERAIAADLATVLRLLNNDFKQINKVCIVYSNFTATDRTKVFDSEFRVDAIFTDSSIALLHVAQERATHPSLTFRILELFEGRFNHFAEYDSADKFAESAA